MGMEGGGGEEEEEGEGEDFGEVGGHLKSVLMVWAAVLWHLVAAIGGRAWYVFAQG